MQHRRRAALSSGEALGLSAHEICRSNFLWEQRSRTLDRAGWKVLGDLDKRRLGFPTGEGRQSLNGL